MEQIKPKRKICTISMSAEEFDKIKEGAKKLDWSFSHFARVSAVNKATEVINEPRT